MNEDEPVFFSTVYRALSEPVYIFRFYFIRLKEFDVILIASVAMLVWIAIDRLNLQHEKIWIFTADPFAYLFTAALVCLFCSALNKLRPDGDSSRVLKGIAAPRHYAPLTKKGDFLWTATARRSLVPKDWRKKYRR